MIIMVLKDIRNTKTNSTDTQIDEKACSHTSKRPERSVTERGTKVGERGDRQTDREEEEGEPGT